jgi:AcrR family transcriptional regulator
MASVMSATRTNRNNSRNQILEVATQLFLEKGFERCTMRNIASATGMRLGGIGYHFKTKQGILFEIMCNCNAAVLAQLKESISKVHTPKEKLRKFIATELEASVIGPGSLILKEWDSLTPEQRQMLNEEMRPFEDLWNEVLNECHKKNIIKADPGITRKMLHGAFAWAQTWYRPDGRYSLERITDEVITLIT